VFIATSIAAIACAQWLFPGGVAQFFYPVVIVACSALVPGRYVFGVAGLASAAVVIVARLQGAAWLDGPEITVPILLNFLAAFAAWLGARQLHLALAWMQQSYTRANELLEQLRDERQHLALTIKMLEDAHYRITKLNYNLIEARSAAEEARRLKAEFAANISHELRTPLNMIIGFSETMANAPETYRSVVWSPLLRGDVEQIYRSSKHLSDLIDDILDLSALEAQQLGLTVEDTELRTVIEEAVGVVHDLYRAKHLYLKMELAPELPRVRIDPIRIRQVLLNILTNATRFTHQGGVTIRARLDENTITVSVTDTGIGIAAHEFGRVFAEFGQVDGTPSRKHEGTGLGIPLSKRLVELHGGRLWLESEVGRGTTFYFTIPVLQTRRNAFQNSEPSPARSNGHSAAPDYRKVILTLESDAQLLRTLRRHMSAYDVLNVTPDADLRALVDYHQPLALLMDSAYRTCELPEDLSAMPLDLPIIKVAMPGSLKSAQSLGIQDYLIKPVLRERLLDAIMRLERPARSILIVDDDPALGELIRRMLQSSGRDFELRNAYQGVEALGILMQQQVDLVLLDLVLPDLNGVDVLYAIRQEPALQEIPVIVISGQPTEAISADTGMFVQVSRARDTSLTEVLTCLNALLAGLPSRDPLAAVAPTLPKVPAVPLAC
jgi:signal transduction histidine kinase/CheY-like chemotaxis protein